MQLLNNMDTMDILTAFVQINENQWNSLNWGPLNFKSFLHDKKISKYITKSKNITKRDFFLNKTLMLYFVIFY